MAGLRTQRAVATTRSPARRAVRTGLLLGRRPRRDASTGCRVPARVEALHYAMGYGSGTQAITIVVSGNPAANPLRDLHWRAVPGNFGPPWFLSFVGATTARWTSSTSLHWYTGALMWPVEASTGPRRGPITIDAEPGGVDVRAPARHQVGNEAAGTGRHRPAQRAVAGAHEQAIHRGRTDDRRAVGRHRPQAGPRTRPVLAHRRRETDPRRPSRASCVVGSSTTDRSQPARPCRRRGCGCRTGSPRPCRFRRARSRPARNTRRRAEASANSPSPDRPASRCRAASSTRSSGNRARRCSDRPRDAHCRCAHRRTPALDLQPGDGGVEAELDAELGGAGRELSRERVAVAGFVVGQAQAGRSVGASLARVPVAHARAHQVRATRTAHRGSFSTSTSRAAASNCAWLRTNYDVPQTALVVLQMLASPQLAQHVAAVLGQAHHPLVVQAVPVARALREHARHPAPLPEHSIETDRERRAVSLEQPLQRLQRDAGRRPH